MRRVGGKRLKRSTSESWSPWSPWSSYRSLTGVRRPRGSRGPRGPLPGVLWRWEGAGRTVPCSSRPSLGCSAPCCGSVGSGPDVCGHALGNRRLMYRYRSQSRGAVMTAPGSTCALNSPGTMSTYRYTEIHQKMYVSKALRERRNS